MPHIFFNTNMSEVVLNSVPVSVVDVYDLASDIGSECEKIIDLYGINSVESLIPKCILVLELLESLAAEKERETSLITTLNERIVKLENEKVERAETKKKFEKEIESIEEAWRCETRDLVELTSRLQADNQRLSHHKKEICASSDDLARLDLYRYDDGLVQKLKMQVDSQRNEINCKNREIQENLENVEQLIAETEHIKYQNSETKKRTKMLQNQVKTLCEERADFLAKIQDQHRTILSLKKQLGISVEEEDDVEKDEDDEPRFTIFDLKEFLAERNELKNRINDLEEELSTCKPMPVNIQETNKSDQENIDDVQGPLPEEWYLDDSWKKKTSKDSGIKKFFRKLFSENETGFKARSFSSLTKMALSGAGSNIRSDIPI